ncbi:MAG: hypothetical protein ACPG07_07115, partial [Henriciella sp.]
MRRRHQGLLFGPRKTGVEWGLTRVGFRSTSGMQKKLRKLIEISGIFDEDWYAKERPDLANS